MATTLGQGAAEARAIGWWARWPTWFSLALLAALPFAFAPIPPLGDLAGHMGRYHVMLALDGSPALQRFYDFDWQFIGNLGVDLLVRALGPALGAERATWAVAATIPMLLVAGLAWLAREAHGRVPAATLLALPLVWSFPFNYGFLNYCLAASLALLTAALWLRMREARAWQQWAVFAPLALLVWLCHVAGWGLLGLIIGGLELGAALSGPRAGLLRRVAAVPLRLLPLTVALVPMLFWRSGAVDAATRWVGPQAQADTILEWLKTVARQKMMAVKTLFAGPDLPLDVWLLPMIVIAAIVVRLAGAARIEPRLFTAGLAILVAFAAMPIVLFGSFFSDFRVLPFGIMLVLLSLGDTRRPPALVGVVALGAVLLFGGRMVATAATWSRLASETEAQLAALNHVEHGSRILVLVGRNAEGGPTGQWWGTHLPSLAIVRRDAFVNTQWQTTGGQLLRTRYNNDTPFTADPSALVWYTKRGLDTTDLRERIARVPPGRFDYVWILNEPRGLIVSQVPWPMTRVWSHGTSSLFRVEQAGGGPAGRRP